MFKFTVTHLAHNTSDLGPCQGMMLLTLLEFIHQLLRQLASRNRSQHPVLGNPRSKRLRSKCWNRLVHQSVKRHQVFVKSGMLL